MAPCAGAPLIAGSLWVIRTQQQSWSNANKTALLLSSGNPELFYIRLGIRFAASHRTEHSDVPGEGGGHRDTRRDAVHQSFAKVARAPCECNDASDAR